MYYGLQVYTKCVSAHASSGRERVGNQNMYSESILQQGFKQRQPSPSIVCVCFQQVWSLQHVTSVGGDGGRHAARRRAGAGNVLARKVGQEASGGLAQSTAGAKDVDLARAAQRRRAAGAVRGRGHAEHLAGERGGLDLNGDILEDVALGQDVGAGADLEGVAGGCVVVPVVVDGVQQRVAANLGGAARHVVDVVVLEGNQVLRKK